MDNSEHYDPDHGDTHRHLNSPEPPLDPLITSWSSFLWEYESFPPSPPPVPNNDFGLTSYQTAAPVQENVPSRNLHSPEPPLDPLITSWPSCLREDESFPPSPPPVPNNDFGLTSYQAAAPVQENEPSRTVDNTKSLIGESDLLPETDFGGSSQLGSGYVTGTEGRGGLTGSKKTGLAVQRERTKNMTREELEQYTDLPRERAARKLNLSVTTFKKLCRKHGMRRWPYKRPGQPK